MLLLGPDQPLERLLVIGAHADDIEIGCGGTILRLLDEHPALQVNWVVMTAHGVRRTEAESSAAVVLAQAASSEVTVHGFRDGFLPYEGAAVKEAFEHQKLEFEPDLILTHYGRDAHQDHRLVADLTWNTFRDHLILEYEIPKYDGDFGQPNVFVRLDPQIVDRKIHHLLEAFPSQHGRRWFTPDLFRSALRVRGMECNAPSQYAEAFYSRKIVL
jgi:LmbE family N-acetylglucosaminyl deacetylase